MGLIHPCNMYDKYGIRSCNNVNLYQDKCDFCAKNHIYICGNDLQHRRSTRIPCDNCVKKHNLIYCDTHKIISATNNPIYIKCNQCKRKIRYCEVCNIIEITCDECNVNNRIIEQAKRNIDDAYKYKNG
jgi:hypothetical protein